VHGLIEPASLKIQTVHLGGRTDSNNISDDVIAWAKERGVDMTLYLW